MADYEYEEATPEEKLRIVTHFILKSPNGEVGDVVSDLRALLNDPSVMSDDAVESILRRYNTEQMFFAKTSDKEQAIVCDVGEIDATHYIDPKGKRTLEFDHKTRKFTGNEEPYDSKVDGSTEAYRAAVQTALDQYASEMFTEGKYATAVYASGNGKLTIMISAKNLNLSNYWSGGWRSVYQLDVSGGSGASSELNGSIRLNVHYFEDGNVQLNTDYRSKSSIKLATPEATGKAVASGIERIEADFQSSLGQFYVDMHNTTFKAMRRFLPVTRKKMDWRISVHSLASSVGGK